MARIYLSPPDVGEVERTMLLAAFDSGWIAPVGPDLTAFESEFAARVEVDNAVAVSSGTAALHLLLHAFGIGSGDVVIVSSFTFAATANAILYTGATPVFVDSELETWNLDPDLVDEAIVACRARGQNVKAVLAVDLYGRCAQYDRLVEICERHDVILFEDAAEALGATGFINGAERLAGGFGVAAAFSFNGNKIITTSGGGMVVSADRALTDRIRYLSTQARQAVEHYEHTDVGFNYRLSNLLAALGRAQLMGLDQKIARRQAINGSYRAALGGLPGVSFDPMPSGATINCWLTCVVVDPAESGGVTRQAISAALSALDIESRPLWKPMHLQPIFAEALYFGRGVSDRLFDNGFCLPSGSNLGDAELDLIISSVVACWAQRV